MVDKKAKKEEPEEPIAEEIVEEPVVEEEPKEEAGEEASVEEEVAQERPVEEEPKTQAPEESEEAEEAARVLGMRGAKLLGFISPAQRAEIKLVIGAEIANEDAAEASVEHQARLAKAEARKRRKQATRQEVGIAAVAAEGRGPMDAPSYASQGAALGEPGVEVAESRDPAASSYSNGGDEDGGCSSCGGK